MSKQHIILIGMMGSGKTIVGEILAKEIERKHIDLDEYICNVYQASIEEIIRKNSLENFRILEEKILGNILDQSTTPLVISLGGGTLTHKNDLSIINNHFSIYLKTDIEKLYQRLLHIDELTKRPLLKNLDPSKLHEKITKISIERTNLYEQATWSVSTNQSNPNEVVQIIKNHLQL